MLLSNRTFPWKPDENKGSNANKDIIADQQLQTVNYDSITKKPVNSTTDKERFPKSLTTIIKITTATWPISQIHKPKISQFANKICRVRFTNILA